MVETHLLDCPLCSDAVDGLQESGSNLQVMRLPEDFSLFKKKLPSPAPAKVVQWTPRRIVLRAAAAAAILIIGYFTWFRPPSNEKLYGQFYSFYESDIPLDRRSGEADAGLNPFFQNALQSYTAGSFAECLPLFDSSLVAEPGNDAARFFAGMAGMETENWEKAAEHFSAVKSNGGPYAAKATWYLALVYLKMDEKEKAKRLLDELIATGNYKKEEAEKLRDWL
jgi:tetratricopeptide (TPR) repeat protein